MAYMIRPVFKQRLRDDVTQFFDSMSALLLMQMPRLCFLLASRRAPRKRRARAAIRFFGGGTTSGRALKGFQAEVCFVDAVPAT